MNKKKLRGIKRKLNTIEQLLNDYTATFPSVSGDYWNLPLPAAQQFISSPVLPYPVKRQLVQLLIDRAEVLIAMKPDDTYRVLAAIFVPDLWRSQLIVFKGNSYYHDFFERDSETHQWLPIHNAPFETDWKPNIPVQMKVNGFVELIQDEDESYKGEVWFFWEMT